MCVGTHRWVSGFCFIAINISNYLKLNLPTIYSHELSKRSSVAAWARKRSFQLSGKFISVVETVIERDFNWGHDNFGSHRCSSCIDWMRIEPIIGEKIYNFFVPRTTFQWWRTCVENSRALLAHTKRLSMWGTRSWKRAQTYSNLNWCWFKIFMHECWFSTFSSRFFRTVIDEVN